MKDATMPDDFSEHLRHFGYLDGYYTNVCTNEKCKAHFIAAKRSWRCKPCAEQAKAEYDAQPRATQKPEMDIPVLVSARFSAVNADLVVGNVAASVQFGTIRTMRTWRSLSWRKMSAPPPR